MPVQEQINLTRARAWIEESTRVVILTGAGISAESGIPTFRDAMDGLWARYSAEELATPEAWQRDPALVSKWYEERRRKVLNCAPNAGHLAIARYQNWAKEQGREVIVLTQNVDGLHFRAAKQVNAPEDAIIEVHGSLLRWRCTRTGNETTDLPEPFERHPLPSKFGGFLRPGVVWFGEALPEDAVQRADVSTRNCDLFISIGTSGLVYPAAGWVFEAQRHGAKTLEVNRDPSQHSSEFDLSIRGMAGEVLPSLLPS